MDENTREVERQMEIISAGCAEIISEGDLAAKLLSSVETGRPLRVKFGIDPTNPEVHIGHMVPCRKLRTFQDLGHLAVLIIGDHTARIGEPAGREAERKSLSEEEVTANMGGYQEQLFKILDPKRTEVHYQSRLKSRPTLRSGGRTRSSTASAAATSSAAAAFLPRS
jgi:tyrosyl-tRNA synthetase